MPYTTTETKKPKLELLGEMDKRRDNAYHLHAGGIRAQGLSVLLLFKRRRSTRAAAHHVRRGGSVAKLWLEPMPEIAESYGLAAHELRELLDVAVAHAEKIERYWNEHFGS